MKLHSHSSSNSNKLSCFFCLRSNSRKYLNSGVDESDSGENAAKEDAVSNFHEFSLRNLYRYLNLLHSDKEERDFKDLKMPICEDCFRLNGDFNQLYNTLEETKLRLNWCIQKIQDVMTKAGIGNEVKVMDTKEEDDDDEKILEIWRTHTSDRIKAFARTSFPRVLLLKNKRKRQYPWIKEDETMKMHIEDKMAITTLKTETIDQKASTYSSSHQQQPQPSNFTDPLSFEDFVEESNSHADVKHLTPNPTSPFPENIELDIRMECDLPEPYMQLSKENTEEHNYDTVTNAENGIRSADLERFSTVQMERKVKSHFKVGRRGRPAFICKFASISKNGRKLSCKSCRKTMNHNEAFEHWKYHCVNGLRQPFISKENNKFSEKCTYCPHVCGADIRGRSGSMLKHKVRFHPEHFLLDENERNESTGFKPNLFRQVLMDNVFPKFTRNTEAETSCSLCGMNYKSSKMSENVISIRQHLLCQHKTELKNDLDIVLRDPLLDDGLNSSSKPSVWESAVEAGTRQKYSSNCPYCPYKCSSRVSGSTMSSSMAKHLVRLHPEHFLLNNGEDHDQVSGWKQPKQTGKILAGIILPQLVAHSGSYRSCSLCGLQYKGRSTDENTILVKKHLLFHHKTKLEEEVNVILEDPLLEERLKSLKSNKEKSKAPTTTAKRSCTTRKEYPPNCLYCRYKCTSPAGSASASGSMLSHLIRFHPEHFLIDEKEKAAGLWHEQFRTILTLMVYPNFILNVDHHRSCSSCGATYKSGNASVNEGMIKRHLIFRHKTELKENIKLVLNDSSLEERLNRSCSLMTGKGSLRETYCKTGKSFSSNCPYCEFKCRAKGYYAVSYSMEKHQVQFHPEYFLLDESERNERSGFKHKHFQKILTDVVLPKFAQKMGAHTSCSLCKTTYRGNLRQQNELLLRRHLIFNHKAELKEELKIISEDTHPSLELEGKDPLQPEKLTSSSPEDSGVMCSCGVYFRRSERCAQTYHEKFHCIHAENALKFQEKVHRTQQTVEENSEMEVGEIKKTENFVLTDFNPLEFEVN